MKGLKASDTAEYGRKPQAAFSDNEVKETGIKHRTNLCTVLIIKHLKVNVNRVGIIPGK